MRTVIAVIFHPYRALFDSISQSCDHFSVKAAQNPQTETAFLARSSIKGRKAPFYHSTQQPSRSPFPSVQSTALCGAVSTYFRLFRREHKNRMLFCKLRTAVSRPCGVPCGVFEGPIGPARSLLPRAQRTTTYGAVFATNLWCFVRRPKIDTSQNKLRMIVLSLVDVSCSSS